MMGRSNLDCEVKEVDVLRRLQTEIINKSRFGLNKLTWQLFEEVDLLENLLDEKGMFGGYRPSSELATVVSGYIQISNQKSNITLLQNIEKEEGEKMRKQFNLICCKLLTKLLRGHKKGGEMLKVKDKIMALNSSKDQLDDIYDMVNMFIIGQEQEQEEYQKRQSMRESLKKQIKIDKKGQFR